MSAIGNDWKSLLKGKITYLTDLLMITNSPHHRVLSRQPPLRSQKIDSQRGLKKINIDIYCITPDFVNASPMFNQLCSLF